MLNIESSPRTTIRESEMFENFKVPKNLIPTDPRFGCGPSKIPVEFVEKLLKTGVNLLGTSHRDKAIRNLVKEIQTSLTDYFNLPNGYQIILANGGATLFFDAISFNLVKERSSHFTCGEFSHKWFEAANSNPFVKAREFAAPLGLGIEVIDTGDDLIAATLNETSTGVQITEFPKTVGVLAVDATSGAGQLPVDFSKVDFFYFSPQKVFASEGGLTVAIVSPKCVQKFESVASSNRYIPDIFNFKHMLENGKKNQTFNTPSISTLFFLNEQIKVLKDLGYQEVVNQAKRKANLLYDWATHKPYLSPFVKVEKYRSLSVATIDVDNKYPVDSLIKRLADDNVAYGINSYRKLGRNQFRISMFHNISYEDLEKLTQIISLAIESI